MDAAAISARLDSLAKPPGSLGTLEHFAATLCAAQGTLKPSASPASVLIFCGDHGVKKADDALSPFPQAVTQSIFRALAAGVSATGVLARTNGAHLSVVDVGIAGDVSSVRAASNSITVVHAKVADGTADCRQNPAMTADECARALAAGRAQVAAEVSERGARVVCIGEIGIGNTTLAAALLALLLAHDAEGGLAGVDIAGCCGRGTGLDDAGLAHKVAVVKQLCDAHHAAAKGDAAAAATAALERVGGLELAAMVGAYLEAAEKHVVALVDGFISGVAALCACRIAPACRQNMLFATALAEEPSAPEGGAYLAKALDAQPALTMGLRLGEGSGAALALPLLRTAAAVVGEMATLDEALALGAA